MEYRLRYRGTGLYTVHERDVVGNLDSFDRVIRLARLVEYDSVTTIFTSLDGTVFQYSTACRNQGNAARMVCFGDLGDSYEKYDDRSLYHSEEELRRVIGRLGEGHSLRELKLVDYGENDGRMVRVPFQCGEHCGKGRVCAGYYVKQQGGRDEVTPVAVAPGKWREFLTACSVYGDGFDAFINLLLER